MSTRVSLGFGRMTPAVKWIIIISVATFILSALAPALHNYLAFYSFNSEQFYIWQPLTYIFTHSLYDPFHLIFNMLMLWIFGPHYEDHFGTNRFLQLFLISGVLAGISYQLVFYGGNHSLVGASAALYAIFVAFLYFWPNIEVLFFMVFLVKAKYVLAILIFIDFIFTISPSTSNIAYLAHLFGAFYGFIFLQTMHRRYPILESFFQSLYNFIQGFKLSSKTKGPKEKAKVIDKEEWVQDKVDVLLEKVSKYGIQSLTKKEKEF